MGIILILIISVLLGLTGLPNSIAAKSLLLQKACRARTPNFEHSEFVSALVCGTNLPSGSWNDALKSTGLLHIAVVSGSHLIWLTVLLRRTLAGGGKFQESVIFLLLSGFCLMTGCGPPVVRAALQILLGSFSTKGSWDWSRIQVCLMSGLVTLCLFPDWLGSLSLLLSWTAALALSSSQSSSPDISLPSAGTSYDSPPIWRKQTRVYLALFFCLLPLGVPHPATIVMNLLVGPLLGAALFPAALVVWMIHPLSYFLSPICDLLLGFLLLVAELLGEAGKPQEISKAFLWIYLWGLQLFFATREIQRARAQGVKP